MQYPFGYQGFVYSGANYHNTTLTHVIIIKVFSCSTFWKIGLNSHKSNRYLIIICPCSMKDVLLKITWHLSIAGSEDPCGSPFGLYNLLDSSADQGLLFCCQSSSRNSGKCYDDQRQYKWTCSNFVTAFACPLPQC